MLNKRTNYLVTLFLIIIFVQCICSTTQKSLTYDEIFHVPRGYSILKTFDFRLDTGHPPLINEISALPLVFLDPQLPTNHTSWTSAGQNDFPHFGYQFFFKYNNDAERMILLSRVMIILLSLTLGIFVFKWANELHGKKAGIFALFLYSFSPEILAHSRFSTTDLGLSLFVFLSLYYFWRYVKAMSFRNLALASLFFGLALLSKYTAVFLIPIFLVIILLVPFCCKVETPRIARLASKYWRGTKIQVFFALTTSLILILLLSGLLINIQYLFKGTFSTVSEAFRTDRYHADYQDLTEFAVTDNVVVRNVANFIVNSVPMPLPYPYIKGLGHVVFHSQRLTTTTFVKGRYSNVGFWYYYFLAFLIKTPLPLLVFLTASLLLFRTTKRRLLDECFLFLPAILFLLIMSFTKQQIGIRHILQIYPLIFVLVSPIVNLRIKSFARSLKIGFYCLCVWYMLGTLFIYPSYLSYFNEFVGAKNGYKYFVDSNLEYGQNLKLLSAYVKENHVQGIKLSYVGPVDPAYYGINYTYLPSNIPSYLKPENYTEDCSKKSGIVAISVATLRGVGLSNRSCFDWIRSHAPKDQIGYTFFVYNITEIE